MEGVARRAIGRNNVTALDRADGSDFAVHPKWQDGVLDKITIASGRLALEGRVEFTGAAVLSHGAPLSAFRMGGRFGRLAAHDGAHLHPQFAKLVEAVTVRTPAPEVIAPAIFDQAAVAADNHLCHVQSLRLDDGFGCNGSFDFIYQVRQIIPTHHAWVVRRQRPLHQIWRCVSQEFAQVFNFVFHLTARYRLRVEVAYAPATQAG